MTDGCTLALIVARHGPLSDGLRALLTTIPEISVVGAVEDVGTVLGLAVEPAPALVLLDLPLPAATLAEALGQIRAHWPDTRCVVMAQHQLEAQELSGADVVLTEGVPAAKLSAAIERLLPPRP